MPYGKIIIALKNIIVDKASTVQSSKSRRNDTSAPMDIGMAAKEDCKNVSQNRRPEESWISRCKLSTREPAKGKCGFGKGQNWNEKGGKESPERVGRVARQDTLQLGAGMEEIRICTPQMKTTARTLKNPPKMRRICKNGACWKKVNMNSGSR